MLLECNIPFWFLLRLFPVNNMIFAIVVVEGLSAHLDLLTTITANIPLKPIVELCCNRTGILALTVFGIAFH